MFSCYKQKNIQNPKPDLVSVIWTFRSVCLNFNLVNE